MTRMPDGAVIYMTNFDEAEQFRRQYRKRHGNTASSRLSVLWGEPWRGWAQGTAIRFNRPFVDLS